MHGPLVLYNTLSRTKEEFKPINPPFVGMYVCGPTVYGDAHLGHAKSYVSFDLIYRYLLALEYKVRYVQNITDVGHLTDDADEGDDKILKQSRLEQIEPMEVVERYMANYYRDMDALNILRPSIAPRPSGHIPEQIKSIEILIEKGLAYEVNGSVYFDVLSYNKDHNYGKLSGRTVEELQAGAGAESREAGLEGQSEKKSPFDFALWKSASEDHLMKWESPWGWGYPGWHIECSVMSQKYLGDTFDIHGGGLENAFPHHECEIAQAEAEKGKTFANYWLHNNMVTINGQKMGKSLGNGVFCHELFSGDNPQLEKAFSPMAVRFFILQSHYRSTLDFSNEALKASEKGLKKLMTGWQTLNQLTPTGDSGMDLAKLEEDMYGAMNDDFNSPVLISVLFDAVRQVNQVKDGALQISEAELSKLKDLFQLFAFDVLGLQEEGEQSENGNGLTDDLMQLLIDLRTQSKADKNYALADQIRDDLKKLKIDLKDSKEGTAWEYEN